LIGKIIDLGYLSLDQIDLPNRGLNPRCFFMYFNGFQTVFLSGQRRTDFLDRKNEREIFHHWQEHHLTN